MTEKRTFTITKILSTFLISLSLGSSAFSMESIPSATSDQKVLGIETVLKSSKLTTLIVGCGKNPYDWRPTTEQGTINHWENDPNRGNHQHPNCLTLAESADVEPSILWDWTKTVPACMKERFTKIYLEKLPPAVLDQDICMQNLFDCLKKGGIAILDHSLKNVAGNEHEVVSPFSISVPPISESDQQQFAKLINLRDSVKQKFRQKANLDSDTPINQKEFENLLKSDKELELLNQTAYRCNEEISKLEVRIRATQQLEAYKRLRKPLNEKVKDHLSSFGFKDVEIKENFQNPFNERSGSTLIYAKKP